MPLAPLLTGPVEWQKQSQGPARPVGGVILEYDSCSGLVRSERLHADGAPASRLHSLHVFQEEDTIAMPVVVVLDAE